jgi:glutamine amidotransferase
LKPVKIVVPDLGLSNLWSARRALEVLGHDVTATCEAGPVAAARFIVLPGVGAFAEASRRLERTGIGPAIREAAAHGAAVLGICLGMQLLFESSEEGGETRGLALLPGRVTHLSRGARVPHVGWNRVVATPRGAALFGNGGGRFLYFVHSYVARPSSDDIVLARCQHGESFPAAVGRGVCLGFQFHPEKSGDAGVSLLGAAISRLAEAGA